MLHTPLPKPSQPTLPPPEAGRIVAALRTRPGDHRAEALAQTAPWLAGLSLCCAALVLWTLVGQASPVLLGGWALAVAAAGALIVRMRRNAIDGTLSIGRAVVEAGLHAGLWVALPAVLLPTQPFGGQILLGAAMGTMIAGAFLLAVVPLAAAVWTVVIAGALVWAMHAGDSAVLASGLALLALYAAVVIAGSLSIERLLACQARAAGAEHERAEAIAQLLREYEEQGAGWLWQTDAHHLISYASPRLCEGLGRSTTQLIGHSLPLLLGCDAALGRVLAAHEAFDELELTIETAHGQRRVMLSATPLTTSDGRFDGYRGFGNDVTEARRAEERIRRVALVDDLTGLPNRQQIRTMLGDALDRLDPKTDRAALLFVDLDDFKPVNDRLGHAVGDSVLKAVAERLARIIGALGHTGRLGGDEFAIVLPRIGGHAEVEDLGNRLLAAMDEPFVVAGAEVHVGLSIGCVLAPTDGETVDDLLEKADIALYQAKSRGRGRMTPFDRAMQRDAEERVLLERDLRQALARNEFHLEYQPVINVSGQAIAGFEALLRWVHPTRGLVPPLIFLPIAEECGMIGGIGEWAIRTACADAVGWPGEGFVSVNLSRAQLTQPGLAAAVADALVATRLQPGRLELEVTETVFQGDDSAPLDVLRRLRALGVGIALDDFGTGYSSLGYLNRAIFHTLKLDGTFVREATDKSESLAVIRAIVALAGSLGMAVTAEGIESFDDFARMRELGCQRVQGYLFGRPAPNREVHALFTSLAQTQAAE